MVKQLMGIGVVAVLAALGACNTSGASGDCSTLTTCCAQLTNASNKTLCTQVVAQGDTTSCGEAQADFEGDSLCVVAAPSGGSSGGGCSGLGACCASLPSADQALCSAIASSGVATTCSAELSSFQASGYCGTTGITGIGSGTGTGGGTGCSGLSSCCGSLPSSEQPGCSAIVSEANDTVCTEELSAYKSAGSCGGGSTTGTGTGGGTGGCATLSSCCSSLPSSEQPGCNSLVTSGNATVCSEEVTAYQAQGYCGGSGGSGGTGTSSGSGGCSSLSGCCSQLPSADQPSCDTLVSDGNDTVCSEELSAYQTDGLCH